MLRTELQETYELWDTLLYDSGVTGTKKPASLGIYIGSGITETVTDDYTTLSVVNGDSSTGMYRYTNIITGDFIIEVTIRDRSAYNRLCAIGVRNASDSNVSVVNLSDPSYDQVFDNKWTVIRFKCINNVFSAQYQLLGESTWHDMSLKFTNATSGSYNAIIYIYNKNTGTTDYIDFKDLKVYYA